MLTNKEVAEFQGSNAELCAACGKIPAENSPPHWANFTAKSIRDRAKIAVAEGRGDELFQSGRIGRKTLAAGHETVKQETVYALPARVSALLPAIAMKCDLGIDVSVKDYIKTNSVMADKDNEAKLPTSVLEVFKFFNMDDDAEAKASLLVYSGVPTKRDLQVERVAVMVKALSDISLKGVSQSTLDLIDKTLSKFAMELNKLIKRDDAANNAKAD